MSEGPRTLVLDIENSPILADVWGLWKNNVGLNQINRDWIIISWAAKWIDEDYTYSDALFHYKSDYKEDPEYDGNILRSLKDMLDEADIVIGHNSNRFDLPKIRARMIQHGILPFSPVREVDTLVIAKQQFRFSSNKLAFIAEALGLGEKMETGGHELWTGCMRGDMESWRLMEEYNCQDVVLTEDVYKALRPWSKAHPNYKLYIEDDSELGDPHRCVVCGGVNLIGRGYSYTNLGKFHRYQCTSCGKWMRGRKNVADRTNLLTNVM